MDGFRAYVGFSEAVQKEFRTCIYSGIFGCSVDYDSSYVCRFPFNQAYVKMEKLKRIHINIWDDYYEDGYIPEGEIQETNICVEDSSVPEDLCEKCVEMILNYMKGLDLEGVNFRLHLFDSKKKYPTFGAWKRWEIKIEHLTHERRRKLVEELNAANLSIDNTPFFIYSES